MRRKTLSVIAFFLSFSLYFSCVDEGVDVSGLSQNAPVTDLMAYAKNLVGEKGEGCSLIDLQKDKPNSRAATDYSTVATPLWDKAWTEQCGAEEVLVVPLQSEDEIRSSMYYEDGLYRRLQHTRTFSRLVIRKKGEDTISQIFTYLPTYHYTKIHEGELESIAFSPLAAKYYGTILISGLDGTFHQGFYYETGKALVRFRVHQHAESNPVCVITDSVSVGGHHHHAHSLNVRLKLSVNLSVASRSYDDGDEDIVAGYCPACGSTDPDHSCVVVEGEKIYCEDCGKLKEECVCLPTIERCGVCGMYYCECFDLCEECGTYPCTCEQSNPEPEPEPETKCEYCGNSDCNGECQESGDEEPEEKASKAKSIFRNSNMTEENWLIIERMLDKIIDDCLGRNLFYGLRDFLNGGTLTIQFKESGEIGGGFGYINGTYGIILDQKMESNQLFHEMMHAYRAYNETFSSYKSSTINGEIEAYYAQYLYTSRLPEYLNSEWEYDYYTKPRSMQIRILAEYLDNKGNLRDESHMHMLNNSITCLVNYLQKDDTYGQEKYKYDSSRDLLSNFNNLRTLTADC